MPAMTESTLTLALHHDDPRAFWSGANYALNMSFGTLRDDQWRRVLELIWTYEAIIGPLTGRYYPGNEIAKTRIETPPPTAAIAQYGMVWVNARLAVGCNVQATRSLFECVSVQTPQGMFEGVTPETHPHIPQLEGHYRALAEAIYPQVPFQLANIGWELDCVLEGELIRSADLRADMAASGGFYAQETLLAAAGIEFRDYIEITPGLRWAPYRS